MEQWEFHDLTVRTVQQFLPRIPKRYAGGFEGTLAGGEYVIALEDLVYTVVDDCVPVSSEERDTLYRLVRYVKRNEELLAKLDGLTLVEDSAGQ